MYYLMSSRDDCFPFPTAKGLRAYIQANIKSDMFDIHWYVIKGEFVTDQFRLSARKD
jgi:hypothetical protein